MAKSGGRVLQAFHSDVHTRVSVADSHQQLQTEAKQIKEAADKIVQFAAQNAAKLELAGRDFAYSLARTYMGKILDIFYIIITFIRNVIIRKKESCG